MAEKVVNIKVQINGKDIDLSTQNLKKFKTEVDNAKKALSQMTQGSAE